MYNKMTWATVCKHGSAGAHHSTKAKNKPMFTQSGEKLHKYPYPYKENMSDQLRKSVLYLTIK